MTLESSRLALDFTGRRCLVTGGGQGIGRSIARTFAAHGASVVIADLAGDRARAVEQEIMDGGGRACSVAMDVTDRQAIAQVIDLCSARFGGLDILVHNAAYFPLRRFADIDADVLERTLAVNLKAAFWLTQEALQLLRCSVAGRVLVTSSVTGPRVAYPGLAHYAASKAGLNGFIRAAALELANARITVNGVEPGMIETAATGASATQIMRSSWQKPFHSVGWADPGTLRMPCCFSHRTPLPTSPDRRWSSMVGQCCLNAGSS